MKRVKEGRRGTKRGEEGERGTKRDEEGERGTKREKERGRETKKVDEGEEEGKRQGGKKRRKQVEEESITVPFIPWPGSSFQGSRTSSTGPNPKVVAPVFGAPTRPEDPRNYIIIA